jgi:hypothetical protein
MLGIVSLLAVSIAIIDFEASRANLKVITLPSTVTTNLHWSYFFIEVLQIAALT